jgi:pimeloyl-ACP methyl ester carboxylesterase
MAVTKKTIQTSHGDIAVSETTGQSLALLMLHGNSSCKEVFASQLNSELGDRFHLIAIDMPGHGASSDAIDPERTYSIPGFADAAIEVLQSIGVDRAAVLGWSLGGHVAIEMSVRWPKMVGMMLVGTPPVSSAPESIQAGFLPNPLVMLIGKEEFTPEEAEAFGQGTYGALYDARFRAAVKRTDGRLRRMTFENLVTGGPADQRLAVEDTQMPVSFVNGAGDPFVNLDYIGGLHCRNLWDRHCYVLRGLGHMPFLQAPEIFNPIFGRFVAEMEKHAATSGRARATKTAAA